MKQYTVKIDGYKACTGVLVVEAESIDDAITTAYESADKVEWSFAPDITEMEVWDVISDEEEEEEFDENDNENLEETPSEKASAS